ncbi:hypothetical protein [Arachnia propionica]|uniref:Uncharacterized protein n=1 Tax=Arachnia propionica TaxID=1750 RepID=A0A3P1WWJ8_9ACTN|nr:hypothetical protein [Arachnia propionica]RRD48753.1 hypothetical protein EII35_11135 [Arachnia propionica]
MISQYRVFVAAPSDVKKERDLVFEVVNTLAYDPFLKGRVSLQVVAWDGPSATVPMLGHLDPQAAISEGLPRPGDCEFVVLILHSRLGTPLPDEYASALGLSEVTGTEWEYHDALRGAERPVWPTELLIYRKKGEHPSDEQGTKVDAFFQALDDAKRGYNWFQDPDDFARNLSDHLRELLARSGRIVDGQTISRWVQHPTTPLPAWVVPFLRDITQDPHQRAGVARAVGQVICESQDIAYVLDVSEAMGETSGGFEVAEQLRLHYAELFPDMTQREATRAVAVFRSFARDRALTAEEREEVDAAAGRMEILIPVLREDSAGGS